MSFSRGMYFVKYESERGKSNITHTYTPTHIFTPTHKQRECWSVAVHVFSFSHTQKKKTCHMLLCTDKHLFLQPSRDMSATSLLHSFTLKRQQRVHTLPSPSKNSTTHIPFEPCVKLLLCVVWTHPLFFCVCTVRTAPTVCVESLCECFCVRARATASGRDYFSSTRDGLCACVCGAHVSFNHVNQMFVRKPHCFAVWSLLIYLCNNHKLWTQVDTLHSSILILVLIISKTNNWQGDADVQKLAEVASSYSIAPGFKGFPHACAIPNPWPVTVACIEIGFKICKFYKINNPCVEEADSVKLCPHKNGRVTSGACPFFFGTCMQMKHKAFPMCFRVSMNESELFGIFHLQ